MKEAKLFLNLFFIILFFSFSSASISVSPLIVNIGNNITISVDLAEHDKDVYFYKENSDEIFYILDLGCGSYCFGKHSYSYPLSDVLFAPGNYVLKLYSEDDKKWFSESFSIICSDNTNLNSCSSSKPL
jgi:hypothetical protein